jgi:glyoxylase-like metal-dependent hydrolase (beta-lactamase superfamily II)
MSKQTDEAAAGSTAASTLAPVATPTTVSTAEVAPADVVAFAVGSLPAVALRDGTLQFPNDTKIFGLEHTPHEVAAVLSAAGAPTDEVTLSLQPLLIRLPGRVVLFDTGAGDALGDKAGKLPAALAAAGIDPGDVTDVFISHAHGDHVRGLLTPRGDLAFPNAGIHMSAPEWNYLRGMDAETAENNLIEDHPAFIAAIGPKVATFWPGAELIPGVVKAVEIRGHTPGHSGYTIGSGDDTLLYIGDAAHSSVVSVWQPEWPNAFDGDRGTAAASREALIAQAAATGQRIYAVHFPFPGLGRFETRGEGHIWVPE